MIFEFAPSKRRRVQPRAINTDFVEIALVSRSVFSGGGYKSSVTVAKWPFNSIFLLIAVVAYTGCPTSAVFSGDESRGRRAIYVNLVDTGSDYRNRIVAELMIGI